MTEINTKEFFGEYVKARKVIAQMNLEDEYAVRGELNQRCLKAFEKFIYSYQWCNSETERQLFDNFSKEVPLIKMHIEVKKGEVIKELKPASIRSASSRLSKRMYDIFGKGCFGVLLGNPKVEADKIALLKLLALCVSLTDDYIFQNHFSIGFQSTIEKYIKTLGEIPIPDRVEFSKEMVDVMTFFSAIDNEFVFSQLRSLDKKCIAQVYTILSKKEYFMQRAELLSYLDRNIYQSSNGVSTQIYEQKIKTLSDQLSSQKEDYERRLNVLTENYEELSIEAKDNKRQVSELSEMSDSNKTKYLEASVKVQELTKQLEDTKETANSKLSYARKRIEELEAQVNSLSNLDL